MFGYFVLTGYQRDQLNFRRMLKMCPTDSVRLNLNLGLSVGKGPWEKKDFHYF